MARNRDASGDRPIPVINGEQCNGCGQCVGICPNGALALEGGLAVVSHPALCNYTGWCVRVCPTGAIDRWFSVVSTRHFSPA